MLLALMLRQQPVTAHQLVKITAASPVTTINSSKGQVYPAIRRLKAQGFVDVERVANDARGTEELSVSELGIAAVREWVLRIDDAHIALDDPLRTRVLSFDILSREEQLLWVARAKDLVKSKRQAVKAFNDAVELPFQQYALASAMGALSAKMESLDELLSEIASRE